MSLKKHDSVSAFLALRKGIFAFVMGLMSWGFVLAAETPINPAPGGEPNLEGPGGILDQLYPDGDLLRIDDDVDQIWLNLVARGSAAAKATFTSVDILDKPEQKGRILGYFGNNNRFHPILELDTSQALTVIGNLGTGMLPARDQLPAFRWGIDPDFSSQPSDNADGADHMVTFLIQSGPNRGNLVLAWEDGDDFDFNDLVVEVDNVAPLKQTPILPSIVSNEPSLLGPGGVLDQLYGIENLTRIRDDDDQFWLTPGASPAELATAEAAFARGLPITLGALTRRDVSLEFEQILVVESFGLNPDTSGSGELPATLYRFGIQDGNDWSSQPSLNSDGQDHMVAFWVGGRGSSTIVIAWEDGDDQDYQDLVVELFQAIPLPMINESVVLESITNEAFDPTPVPGGPAGTYAFTAIFKNGTENLIPNPFPSVVALSSGESGTRPSLECQEYGVKWWPEEALFPKGEEGDTMELVAKIGLQKRAPFSLFIDLFSSFLP